MDKHAKETGNFKDEAEKERLYRAFCSHDVRFDGRFFVAVKTTGIYCRPTCHAKMPKYENCTFYTSAAEAEKAGYRPCLTCRPELAPEYSLAGSERTLAHLAERQIRAGCSSSAKISDIANFLGCSERHLRRVFEEKYHVSPMEYLLTCRLLLAKNLLTDTVLPVTDIAYASGFGSLRRFNDAFKRKYNLAPTQLRKRMKSQPSNTGTVRVSLGYQPPFRWDKLLEFLSLRAIPGVEFVETGVSTGDTANTGTPARYAGAGNANSGRYMRTVSLADASGTMCRGWISVENDPKHNRLDVTISEGLLPVLPRVLGKVRSLFDLYCDPSAVAEVLENMGNIFIPGIRVPGCFDAFELCVRAVLGQQITVKAASTLAGRFAAAFGAELEVCETAENENTNASDTQPADACSTPMRTFPSPQDILAKGDNAVDIMGSIGIIHQRAEVILELARMMEHSTGAFDFCMDPEAMIQQLCQLRGVGPWTANYIAMRALGYTDAFPAADLGIKKVLAPMNQKEIKEAAEKWRPWRAYATMCIWNYEEDN